MRSKTFLRKRRNLNRMGRQVAIKQVISRIIDAQQRRDAIAFKRWNREYARLVYVDELGPVCVDCGAPTREIDHLVHRWPTRIKDLERRCRTCNAKKGEAPIIWDEKTGGDN